MTYTLDRRSFLGTMAGVVVAGVRIPLPRDPLFRISLAEWSLHRTLFARRLDNLDFPGVARTDYGLDAVEYVNQFFKDKAEDMTYLRDLKGRADGHGVENLLIMCDGEGALGDPDPALRAQAVENHHKWVTAAAFLGCHSIRVNARSEGTAAEQQRLAADGLRRLTEFAAQHEINVIVENHGGLSSNGQWLTGVMKTVNNKNCGTLPDFGNFGDYDRYQGVKELMPFARSVSAKSKDFDDEGNETQTDFYKMMKIVVDAGYRDYVGIEFEGSKIPEVEGVKRTKTLLEKVRDHLAAST